MLNFLTLKQILISSLNLPFNLVDSADYTFYLGNNNVRDANQVMIDSSVNINGRSAEVDEVENSGLNLPQPWLQQRQQLGFW